MASLGAIDIDASSLLDVSNQGGLATGGSVFVNAGTLMVNASIINADNYGSGSGGTVALRGDRTLMLRNGSNVYSLAREPAAAPPLR